MQCRVCSSRGTASEMETLHAEKTRQSSIFSSEHGKRRMLGWQSSISPNRAPAFYCSLVSSARETREGLSDACWWTNNDGAPILPGFGNAERE